MFKAHNPSIEKSFFYFKRKKKRIHNNEFSLPVCIFKEYFNCWGTFHVPSFKRGLEGQSHLESVISFTDSSGQQHISQSLRGWESLWNFRGLCSILIYWAEQCNRSTYFEDLGEDEPEASECSGEIGWRVSESWKTAEGWGCDISLGDTVGGLAGTVGVVGGTDGPGSGSKFYSV